MRRSKGRTSFGRPNPLVEVKLFDFDMNEVKVGEPGEICVRGALVMNGYWKRPDATDDTFRGGWLHTGDVAVQDEDGYFYRRPHQGHDHLGRLQHLSA